MMMRSHVGLKGSFENISNASIAIVPSICSFDIMTAPSSIQNHQLRRTPLCSSLAILRLSVLIYVNFSA